MAESSETLGEMQMVSSLSPVIDYLEEVGSDPTELTVKKIYDRGIFLEADKDSGKIYFEVERHNAILGAMYSPGCPMAAFVTRWIKYSFDGQVINEIADNRPPIIDMDEIDFDALADDLTEHMSFSIEKDEKGKYRITESMCRGDETIVSSMKEVRAYARSTVEEWDFDYLKDTIDAPISEGEIREIIEKLSSAIIASAVEKAERAAEYEGYFA
jgi:hypothetical protein